MHRRTIWNLRTGKVIDECIVDDIPDEILHRELKQEEDVRVELVMKDALSMYERKGADIVELFSQPRIAQVAAGRSFEGTRLTPGWSLDLTRSDPKTGKPWDLGRKDVQARVTRMVEEGKPLFIVGSPPCTAFSSMQNITIGKRCPDKVADERKVAEAHMRFCMKLYRMQVKGNRFFVH